MYYVGLFFLLIFSFYYVFPCVSFCSLSTTPLPSHALMPQAQDLLFDKDDSPMFLSNFLKALTQAPRPVLLTASAVHVVAAEAVMAQISFGMLLSCCF